MSRWHDDPYYDDDPGPGCEHQDASINWEGDWDCPDCQHHWPATLEELNRDAERQREYDRQMHWLEWKMWADHWFGWAAFWRPFVRLWKRWRDRKAIDDEIPF